MIEKTPAYVRIAEIVGRSIRDGRIPPGAILLEGPLAALFRSSRSPVKQALSRLQNEGLLHRFEGRGLVVGSGAPIRFEITPEALGSPEGELIGRSNPLDALYYRIEREIILHSMLGPFRINELAFARHHRIGRAIARDVLIRAQQAGIVTKGEKAHWRIVAFDAARCRNLYELRLLLEPVALAGAAHRISAETLEAMAARLQDALARFPALDVAELDALESDLHVTCVGCGPNLEIVEALRRTHPSHIAGKHLQIVLDTPRVDPFLAEHLRVIEALIERDAAAASEALVDHLVLSRDKVIERLSLFLQRRPPPPVDYIMR